MGTKSRAVPALKLSACRRIRENHSSNAAVSLLLLPSNGEEEYL